MKKGFLFISCVEAMHICDKAEYGEATWWEKIEFNIRLSWCRITKGYYKKNKQLSAFLNKSHPDCLKSSERQQLEKHFAEKLKKNQK